MAVVNFFYSSYQEFEFWLRPYGESVVGQTIDFILSPKLLCSSTFKQMLTQRLNHGFKCSRQVKAISFRLTCISQRKHL